MLYQWHSPTFGASSVSEIVDRMFARSMGATSKSYTAMSDLRVVFLSSVAYLLVIFVLRLVYPINKPPAFGRGTAFVAVAGLHNLALSVASLYMNVGVSRVLYDLWRDGGLTAATVCNPVGQRLYTPVGHWIFLFYLSKYWEFVDTVLLVFRGRPLTLLHVWHHASVPIQVFFWLDTDMAIGVYGLWANTFVHTLMYAYFAAALWRIRVPWKKALTSLQIFQFIVSFVSLIPWANAQFSHPVGCTGNAGLLYSGVMNAIFLFLFVQFYDTTYVAKTKPRPDQNTSKEEKEL